MAPPPRQVTKPGDGRVQGYPPVTFPFYGLVGWDGPRWLEFFEGASGHPVTTLWLGHHRRDSRVTTLWLGHHRRDSRAHLTVGSSTDRGVPDIDTELAFAVAFALTERMRPDRSTAPPADGIQPRPARSRPAGRRHRVAAALLAFRRWLGSGYMSGMGEVSIKLVSAGTTPTGLALETVRDPAVYDFDPTRRLYLSQLAQAHRRRPGANQ